MITLQQVNNNPIDLAISNKFNYHYGKSGSFAKYILDNEINNGMWFDQILATLPDDSVIIDAGMNVGLFTLYLEAKNRKFYCIEPCANHILVAKDLFEKFGYDAEIYEGVLFNKDGMTSLWEAPENTTSNRVGEGAPLKVECRRLKTFLEERGIEHVDLLKMDIEGSEKAVILEDPTIGEALQKCQRVFIETHVADGYLTPLDVIDLIKKICSLGFEMKEAKRKGSFYFIKS